MNLYHLESYFTSTVHYVEPHSANDGGRRVQLTVSWSGSIRSSNVLHTRALLQKSATGCLVHHYSYPSDQFVENNTLDQTDVTK